MRSLVAYFAGAACAALTFAFVLGFTSVAGGSECDRSECNAIGEFSDEHSLLTLLIAIALALLAGVIATRSWRGS